MQRDGSDGHTHTMSATRSAPADEGRSARAALVWRVVSGSDAGKAGEIAEGHAIVGRVDGVDIRLTDATVSQFHAEIWATEGGIVVRDLGSHNGTVASGIALRHASVPTGSELQIGDTVLEVCCGARTVVERSKATFFGSLVGASPAMRELYVLLERLARAHLAVLIEGEVGSGKELAARALHDEGARARGPWVAVNCAGIPPALAESVLFGHEPGALPGTPSGCAGALEAASGGTVFLDEVAELPRDLQAKLLRALERREVLPVGASSPRAFDTRVVSATWQGLRELVNRGAFREDLYYRLAQARIRLPSLRERTEDIKPLVQHFLSGIPWDVQAARAITSEALDAIAERSFPGNVRELKATVERVAMLAEGPTVTVQDLAFERLIAADRSVQSSRSKLEGDAAASPASRGAPASSLEPFKEAKRTVIDDFEKAYLTRLLARSGTNISRASALAGIERQSLRDLLKRHGLRGDDGEKGQ
jgi:DNA-binding NtrC family response regulator